MGGEGGDGGGGDRTEAGSPLSLGKLPELGKKSNREPHPAGHLGQTIIPLLRMRGTERIKGLSTEPLYSPAEAHIGQVWNRQQSWSTPCLQAED